MLNSGSAVARSFRISSIIYLVFPYGLVRLIPVGMVSIHCSIP